MFDITGDPRDPAGDNVTVVKAALLNAQRLGKYTEWAVARQGEKFLALVAEDTDSLIASAQLWGVSMASPALIELQAGLRAADTIMTTPAMQTLAKFTAHHRAQNQLHTEIAALAGATLRPRDYMPEAHLYALVIYARIDIRQGATTPDNVVSISKKG